MLNNFAKIKHRYEQDLIDVLSRELGYDPALFTINCGIETTTIIINDIRGTLHTQIRMTYDDQLTISANTCELLVLDGAVVGSRYIPMSFTAPIVAHLDSVIYEVLSRTYGDDGPATEEAHDSK